MVKLRSNPSVLTGALLAALGVVPQACGGQSASTSDDETPGGGSGATGGSSSTGGSDLTGGNSTGGDGATGGANVTGGSGGSLPVNRYPCENPVEVFPGSGFFRCESGAWHRRSVETCAVLVPRPDPLPEIPGAACASDLDCQDLPYGHCENSQSAELAPRICWEGCASDADCEPGQICECGEFVGKCISASCTSDADCASGFLCQTHDNMPGCSGRAYACQVPSDACASDADCNAASRCSAGYQGLDPRSCVPRSCVPGRPFLVGGELRTAGHAPRADWALGCSWPEAATLSPATRERIGSHYAECAALEHASVASFARFTLGLLAVGAPPELVAESVRAMGDEIEHARVAYDLASHFLGRSVGPGALDVTRALAGAVTLDELAVSTFVEGCLDETLGALEARETSLHAEHPALHAALDRIADDETRHAALAFRFVAWALERSGPALAVRLAHAFENARAEHLATEDRTTGGALEPYGVLSAAKRRAIRARGYSEVIAPCVTRLLERSEHAPSAAALASPMASA